jgi:hypothetical protein
MRIRIRDLCERDGKNSDSGSGIIIPDPQHWNQRYTIYTYEAHTLVHIRYNDILRLLSDRSSQSLQTFPRIGNALYGRVGDV